MKKIKQLKISWDTLLGVYSMFTIISTVLLLVALLFNDLPNYYSLISQNEIKEIDNYIRIIVFLMAIGNVIYIVVLFKLKKLISLFMNQDFFTNDSIRLLQEIGKYLSYSTIY